MPKILITGNCGFIFSHVTDYFLEKGWEVVGIDNLSEGSHPELLTGWSKYPNFKFWGMDVSYPKVIDIILEENPEYVIHASAISCVDTSIREPLETIQKNILSTLNVFEAVRNLQNLKKFIYVSTDEVAGECDHRKTEDEIIFPRNPYACSKAMGSLLRMAYDNTYESLKDKTAETRFCNCFGDRQDKRKILGIIKKFLKDGTEVPVHNEGIGYREYLYVKNIPPLLDLILEKGNRTYNITLNDGFTVKDLIKKVEGLTDKKIKTKPSERKGMDLRYSLDNSRIIRLGWKPLYTFKEGINEYLNA